MDGSCKRLGFKPRGFPRSLALVLMAAAPIAVMLTALGMTLFLFMGETELTLLHHNAPEFWARLIGIRLVALMILLAATLLTALMHPAPRAFLMRRSAQLVDTLSLSALVALGSAFAVFDMSFSVAESTEIVLMALLLGLVAAWPLLFRRARSVRSLLLAIALFGVFAGWIVVQRQIDWNMRRPFRRAYSQIQPGMTREQVEAIMRRQFPRRRPVARFDRWGIQYTLDPDDGRFNSEFIMIEMNEGKVISTHYFFD